MGQDELNERVEAERQAHSRLRILQVTARFFPYLGGIETHVWEVSRRLAAGGADVTVLTTDPSKELAREERVDGVHIIRVPAYPAHRDYYYAPEVYRALRKSDGSHWDVVHVQGCHTLVAPLAMLAARRAGLPYLLTFHSGGHSSGWREGIRGAQWRAQRRLYAHAQRLIGVSRFEAEHFRTLLRLPTSLFTVVPNGGNLPRVDRGASAIAHEFPHIVSVGRLERYKGHHRVIAAMPLLLARYPRATLRVIGAGPYEGELRRLVHRLGLEKHVEIGAIAPEDRGGMAAALASANLVTLLSDYESQGIAVVEAIALGRPVLVTATTGLLEFAERGLAAEIPPTSQTPAVAAAIASELDHPHIPTSVDLPTWDDCAEMLRNLYLQTARATRAELVGHDANPSDPSGRRAVNAHP
ncbi:MAG TPA: glycosyltransferase family 4 protein [Ktedonobacterales bacterium]|jgi:glycosyltransferase involved in cell wall biosynthesis